MNRSLNIFKTTISGLVLAACTLFYSNAYAQWCTGDDYTCWGTAQARQEIEDAANRGRELNYETQFPKRFALNA